MHPAVAALLVCSGAAALEGVLSGKGIRKHFDELRQPSWSPPLALWFVIGGAYYVICFVLLYRLLASGLLTGSHLVALFLLLAFMLVNAAWGWVFFRKKDLRASFLAFVPYGLIAIALELMLTRIDRTSALVLTPYLAYLVYAVSWSHRLWVLNRTS